MLLPPMLLLPLLLAAVAGAAEDSDHVNNLERLQAAFQPILNSTLLQVPGLGSLSNAADAGQRTDDSSIGEDAESFTSSERERKDDGGNLLFSALSAAQSASRRAFDMLGLADNPEEEDSSNVTATNAPTGESTTNTTRVRQLEGDDGANVASKASPVINATNLTNGSRPHSSANMSAAYDPGTRRREKDAEGPLDEGSSDYLGYAIVGMSLAGIAILLLTVRRNQIRARAQEGYIRAAAADRDYRPADVSKRYSDISLQLLSEANGSAAEPEQGWKIQADVGEIEEEEENKVRPRPGEPCSTL